MLQTNIIISLVVILWYIRLGAAARCKTEVPIYPWFDSVMDITTLGFGSVVQICKGSECTSYKKKISQVVSVDEAMVLKFKCLLKKGCGDFKLSTPATDKGIIIMVNTPYSNCLTSRTLLGGTKKCNVISWHGRCDFYNVEAGKRGWAKVDIITPVSCT